MRRALIFGLALLMFLTLVALGQPVEEWNVTFGGNALDWGYSVLELTDGGYVIAGSTASYGSGQNDLWLIKTDYEGNELWNRTFGGDESDFSSEVLEMDDGGYLLLGSTKDDAIDDFNLLLIKTDSEGLEEWNKTFGGSKTDLSRDLLKTRDGGYVLGGDTESYGTDGSSDFWLIKVDPEGNESWNRTFGGIGSDYFGSVRETDDVGYILFGSTSSYGNGNFDLWLIKTDPEGHELWNRTFGEFRRDNGVSALQTEDGGYLLMGRTRVDNLGISGDVIWLIKTDSEGNEEWENTLEYENGSYVGVLIQSTNDGGYLISGDSIDLLKGLAMVESSTVLDDKGRDVFVIKVDSEGNELWRKTFETPGLNYQHGLAKETKDGGYIVLFAADSYGKGRDLWLIKLGPD